MDKNDEPSSLVRLEKATVKNLRQESIIIDDIREKRQNTDQIAQKKLINANIVKARTEQQKKKRKNSKSENTEREKKRAKLSNDEAELNKLVGIEPPITPAVAAPLSTMSWMQRHMQLAADVHRQGDNVTVIALNIPAPGQRGIMQALVQGKRDLQSVRPALTTVHKTSKPRLSEHEHQKQKVTRLAEQVGHVLHYCRTVQQRHTKKRAEKLAYDDDDDDDAGEHRDNARSKRAEAQEEVDADELIVSRHQLSKIINGLEVVEKGATMARRIIEDDKKIKELEATIKESHLLVEELRRQIENQKSLGNMWMHTKWTREASTAVGRGPPGNIAFNPFSIHDPPFEKQEVTQIIVESLHQQQQQQQQNRATATATTAKK